MMTEFRAYIRSRVGPRVSAGLDGLTPLFVKAQARRGLAGPAEQIANLATAPLAADAAPVQVASRSVEQVALRDARGVVAAQLDGATRGSRVGQSRSDLAPLRLVVDHDRPALDMVARHDDGDHSAVRRSHGVAEPLPVRPVSAPGASSPNVSDRSAVTRRSEPVRERSATSAQLPPQDAVHQTSGHGAEPRWPDASSHDGSHVSPVATDGTATVSAEHANEAAASVIEMLRRAAQRRAVPMVEHTEYPTIHQAASGTTRTMPHKGIESLPRQAAPIDPANIRALGSTPAAASIHAPSMRVADGVDPVAASSPKTVSPSPLERLDHYLPRAGVRRAGPLSSTSHFNAKPEADDDFAFDLKVQAALARLLQHDMRRHGLHPHGEVL